MPAPITNKPLPYADYVTAKIQAKNDQIEFLRSTLKQKRIEIWIYRVAMGGVLVALVLALHI